MEVFDSPQKTGVCNPVRCKHCIRRFCAGIAVGFIAGCGLSTFVGGHLASAVYYGRECGDDNRTLEQSQDLVQRLHETAERLRQVAEEAAE